jgi:glycosyltransferase involved in cell wall biosynthesis
MMRIAYFTGQYPAISHTFIKREMRALESLGMNVLRYATRRPFEKLVDPEDIHEQEQTSYLVDSSIMELLSCFVRTCLRQPIATIKIFRLATTIGWRSDRGILLHFVYALEAMVVASWCRRDGVEHLHAHFGTTPAFIAMLAERLSGVPYSFTVHGPEEFDKAPLLSLDKKLERAAFAACVSSFGRSQLMLHAPPDQWRKIALVRCGLDETYLDTKIAEPPASPRLVCVGRICEQKAQLVLVSAASRLRQLGVACDIVLVGDGPMRPQVEEAIRQANLNSQITITGWTTGDQVKAQILNARALVLPSFSENLPVVIMEAMALGRPIVSTYIAGIPELVRPGVNGWLVPASDEAALAEAMRDVLTAPVARIAEMGAAARADVLAAHDVYKEAGKLKDLIRSCHFKAESGPEARH